MWFKSTIDKNQLKESNRSIPIDIVHKEYLQINRIQLFSYLL